MRRAFLLFLILAMLVAGCQQSGQTRQQLDESLSRRMTVGMSRPEIEKVLDEHGVTHSYDDFQNRYQGVVRKPYSDAHALTVHVYLDEKGEFRSLEVRDSYTAP